jgi:hypothetical protein
MHHFDDELETLKVIFRTLVPGGRIYIREGSKPPPGSEAERNLVEEMRRHGTLESPFEPGYLLEILAEAGFEDVKRLLAVDELVDVTDLGHPARGLKRFLDYRRGKGEMNTILARKPVGVELASDAANFSAQIEPHGGWDVTTEPGQAFLVVTVVNTGMAFWPSGTGFPFPQGVVTVAPYALGPDGERIELGRTALPHGVSPGQSVPVLIRAAREAIEHREVRIDLVREGLAWFSELGSEPLVVPAEG